MEVGIRFVADLWLIKTGLRNFCIHNLAHAIHAQKNLLLFQGFLVTVITSSSRQFNFYKRHV